MAIVLDGKVQSAPSIRSRISGGAGIIEGPPFSYEEARDLAIVLRAGALPVPLTIIENRVVGPSLGRDSIDRGVKASLVGVIVVVAFILVYYRASGGIADFALLLNFVILLAVLSLLRATLTLPGIAGVALTLGMAVDANVLIFERIREELRVGRTVRAAIDAGYRRAFWTIFDSNITTLIAAVFLFQFGTGPVRGFAVTLTLGILISMFTAIVVTRVVFDLATRRRDLATLSI
jgi:preprotein translocase subunit SecD